MSWLEAVRRVIVVLASLLPLLLGAQGTGDGARLFEAGRLLEARTVFEPALMSNAKDTTAAYYLGRIAFAEEKYERSADYFESATKVAPGNTHYFLWLGRAYGRQAQRANILRQTGLAKKTRAAWEEAVRLDPDNLDAREDLIEYYMQAPGIMGGSHERAFEQAEEIRKRQPLRGLLQIGELYEREKKVAEAERTYLAATMEPAERPVASYRLGILYQNTGAFDKAFDVFETMLREHPSEIGALFQIGKTGAMSGQRLERAEEALNEYLKATPGRDDPPRAAAHWRLGMVHERKSDRDRAKIEYQSALRLDPTFKPAQDALKKLG
jgi:tetratricopeptide (TPR) repeat protein